MYDLQIGSVFSDFANFMDTQHILVDPQSVGDDAGCTQRKATLAKAAVIQGIVGEERPLALIYDLARLQKAIATVKEVFPEEFFLHTTALKANPLQPLLRMFRQHGVGFEAASLGELTWEQGLWY